jgi:hypothetical protein
MPLLPMAQAEKETKVKVHRKQGCRGGIGMAIQIRILAWQL